MSRTRIPHLFAIPLAVFALAFGLVACGGGGAQSVLDDATLEGIDSAAIELSLDVAADGKEGGKVATSLSGAFQSQGDDKLPQLDLTVSSKGGFGGEKVDFDGGLVLLRNSAYVNYEGVEYEVDPTTFSFVQSALQRAEQENAGDEDAKSSACKDALAGFKIGEHLDNLSEEDGGEVGGVATTKVSGDLDVGPALEDLLAIVRGPECKAQLGAAGELPSETEIEDAQKEIGDTVKSARAEVYVGEDDIVRRISAQIAIEPEDREPGDPQKVDVAFDLELTGVNEPQRISAPRNGKPLSQLFIKLGVNPIELIGLINGEGGTEGLEDLLEGFGGLKGLNGALR